MKTLSTDQIRESFLRFFESKGHKIAASDGLVPKGDPTLLFTGAGMNQFKEQFLGKNVAFKREATCQKCLRTDDLDKVGKTPCHHTFFEMLGNFSFGDYFKKEAIEWAWEFMTKVLEVPSERLWVSVYKDDEETYKIWSQAIKIPKNKIVQLGEKENFWPSEAPGKGPNGPCGPCSEIFYDYGKEYGCGKPGCSPSCECGRFVEVWNLVFTQFDRVGVNELLPLPSKNIDTGMGLERIASVMQGVYTNFEIDIFVPLIDEITRQTGSRYKENSRLGYGFGHRRPNHGLVANRKPKHCPLAGKTDSAIHAIADHIRAVAFAICDGVLPSNEERGYVVRKLIRKGSWHGRQMGRAEPFLYKLVPVVAKVMEPAYPELTKRRENISQIVLSEEKRFAQTLESGQAILNEEMAVLDKEKKKIISGEFAFKLYDTYGFPVELTAQIAGERGLTLEMSGFELLMAKQRERAREKSAILRGVVFAPGAGREAFGKTEFVGYDVMECEARVVGIIEEEGIVILDKTPFYAEAGGQAGDKGIITRGNAVARVSNTKHLNGAIAHYVEGNAVVFKVNDAVRAEVDKVRRFDIMRNHTATHLLQGALRETLGEHVHQAGSLVDEERLRFDFTHFGALDQRTLERVEELVNDRILKNDTVLTDEMPAKEAVKSGAIALFGEKYGDVVRVVKAGDSAELCGGTHVKATGQIGLFKIVSEGSVQSGVRRIEAQTGRMAYKKTKESEEKLKQIIELLKTGPDKAVAQLEKLIQRAKSLEKEVSGFAAKKIDGTTDEFVSHSKDIGGVKVIAEILEGAADTALRKNIDLLREKVKSGIFVFGSQVEGRAIFACGVTDDLAKAGINAGKLLQEIAKSIGGTAGGNPRLAQGGAKDSAKLGDAMKNAFGIIEEELGKIKGEGAG